jgi:hypothetical protein
MTRLVTVMTVLVVALLASSAAARTNWYYRMNNVACSNQPDSGGMVLATAPLGGRYGNVTSYGSRREDVLWRSQLQGYYAGQWHVVNNLWPWLKGAANAAGILPFNTGGSVYYWVDTRNNQILEHAKYLHLPHGSYRVLQFFRWPKERITKASYSHLYNSQQASYCPL